MDPDILTRLLADRLSRIAPDGFHVEAAGGMLWYSADEGRFPGQQGLFQAGKSGTYVRDNFSLHGETPEDHVVGVARQALDELQDYVDEASHDPWPGDRRVPRANAEIRDAVLHLWYGEQDEVVLACEPISLGDLEHPSRAQD